MPVNERVAFLVFAKAPVPGKVMTRLIPELGAEGAAWLHETLVRRTLSTVVEARAGDVQLWCSPTTEHGLFHELRTSHGIPLFSQKGVDLGERMHNAMELALADAGAAVLLGTDCADLTARDLRNAADALTGDCDAVLGPAADGGYVLIGLRRPAPELFKDIAWGTSRVLESTRKVLQRSGMRWLELEVRHDIDRPEDLHRLPVQWTSRL